MTATKPPPWNPEPPPGATRWTEAKPVIPVPPALTAWAEGILHDAGFAMWSTATMVSGDRLVLARVEWHTEQARTGKHGIFRGVSLYVMSESDEEPTTPAPQTQRAKAANGIDVSHYQHPIDWSLVAAKSGASFVLIKASEGITDTDESFAEHWQGAREHGLLRGAYHFFRTTSDPIAQVRRFVEIVESHGPSDLPLALDVEWQHAGDPLGGMTAAAFADAVVEAVQELKARTQRVPLLYTAPGFWDLLPHRPVLADLCHLWIAHFDVQKPRLIAPWPRWVIWQTTEKALVPGVGGHMDADVFCGSVDELREFALSGMLPDVVAPRFDLYTTAGVQAALNALGSVPKLDVDGKLGPRTIGAIKTFQRMHMLTVDGTVGRMTREAIEQALAKL